MRFFRPNVEKLKANKDVTGLCNALHDNETIIRRTAVEALRDICDVRAVESLCHALKDGDNNVRQFAVQALGKIGDARAVKALCVVLNDKERAVREYAAQALAEIGDAGAVQPLFEMLRDSKESIAARQALQIICDTRDVQFLCLLLKDNNTNVRSCAAELLGKIGSSDAVEPLCNALQDDDWGVSNAAARSLGIIGDMRAADALVECLPTIGKSAASALRQLKYQPATPRQRAVLAIVERRAGDAAREGTEAVEPLMVEIDRLITYPSTRSLIECLTLVKALGEIGDVRSVDLLVQILTEKRFQSTDHVLELRIATAKALGIFNEDAAVSALSSFVIRYIDPTNRREIAFPLLKEVMAALGHSKSIKAIEPLLDLHERITRERDSHNQDVEKCILTSLSNILNSTGQFIEIESLKKISTIQDYTLIIMHYPDCSASYAEDLSVDFAQVRQMARQELIRRGLDA